MKMGAQGVEESRYPSSAMSSSYHGHSLLNSQADGVDVVLRTDLLTAQLDVMPLECLLTRVATYT